MNTDSIFRPEINETKEYGRRVSDLFYALGYASEKEIEALSDNPIPVGRIPFSLRAVGIPSGNITLLPKNVPHMVGFGPAPMHTHMHDLTLQELLEIPNMVSDPDIIFRSNTKPNASILLCKEVDRRGNPVVLAMRIEIHDSLQGGSVIVSGYEKDNSPDAFFHDLYRNGYCIYDGEKSEYFQKIKLGPGAGDHHPGPIPGRAATCTDPLDKRLPPEGISPSGINRILTKTDAVNLYRKNALELVAVLHESPELQNLARRNLEEMGYHTVSPRDLSTGELNSLLTRCTGVACDRDMLRIIRAHLKSYPNITRTGEARDFLPEPIFRFSMKSLAELRNEPEKDAPRRKR